MLAAPLGIVFSRRGATGAVALAVFLCGGMLFVSNLSLALGESGYLAPALAAWAPNVLFGLIALYFFHRRMTGLPIYQTIRRLIPLED
jgi:lipopolysaccharide export LptBFGC system permease protein LptF